MNFWKMFLYKQWQSLVFRFFNCFAWTNIVDALVLAVWLFRCPLVSCVGTGRPDWHRQGIIQPKNPIKQSKTSSYDCPWVKWIGRKNISHISHDMQDVKENTINIKRLKSIEFPLLRHQNSWRHDEVHYNHNLYVPF